MPRPVLVTERLRLEPLTEAYAEDLVELDSDPEVMRYVFGRALSPHEVQEWLPRRTRVDADARGIGYWAGHERGEFVGWWALMVVDDDDEAAELGYRLRRAAWGRGLATEGARALIAHGFATAGLTRIWAAPMAVNSGSRRVLEKLGMRPVREHVPDRQRPVEAWDVGHVFYEVRQDGG